MKRAVAAKDGRLSVRRGSRTIGARKMATNARFRQNGAMLAAFGQGSGTKTAGARIGLSIQAAKA